MRLMIQQFGILIIRTLSPLEHANFTGGFINTASPLHSYFAVLRHIFDVPSTHQLTNYLFHSCSEAPCGKPRGIFTSFAEPAEADPPFHPPQSRHVGTEDGRQGYGGYPFRIHPRPSGRGFLRRRVIDYL
jgi:hypothetical protein